MAQPGWHWIPVSLRRNVLTAFAATGVLLTAGSLGSAGVSVPSSAVVDIATQVDDITPSDPFTPPSSPPPEADPSWLLFDPDYWYWYITEFPNAPIGPSDFSCPNLIPTPADPTVCPPACPNN